MLFRSGITPATEGEILIDGKPVRIGSPEAARDLGIAYVPEDRGHQGLIRMQSIEDNIALANLKRLTRGILMDMARITAEARQAIGAAIALVAEVSSPSSWRESLLAQVELELESGVSISAEHWMLLERMLSREPRTRLLLARRAARAGERTLARRYLDEVGEGGRLGLDAAALRAAMLAEEGRQIGRAHV